MIDATFAVIENEEQRNELAAFYEKYKHRLYHIALKKIQNEIDAEDAVQEVFSDIADKPERFFEISSDKRLAYVDVMLRNIAVDMFKQKNNIRIEELNEDIEDDGVSLENTLFDKIWRGEIVEFINNLPTMRRSVLMFHCFFDMSITEISQRLNISPATVRKHLALARKAVREFIDERNKLYE